MAEKLPPPIEAAPSLTPVAPPPGSPDFERRNGVATAPPSELKEPVADKPSIAELDFVGERVKRIPLNCPFRLNGKLVKSIEVRRLSVIAVSQLVADDRYRDLYEIYSEMTGLPAAVLRGLDADDGERVTEVTYSFLPRLLATVHGSPSP